MRTDERERDHKGRCPRRDKSLKGQRAKSPMEDPGGPREGRKPTE